jgi:hypothetical protein
MIARLSFSTKIFKLADVLEVLKINFNIALIPFFHEKEDPEKNTINVRIDENRLRDLITQEPSIIRTALHPRDPHSALNEQKDMINKLKEEDYTIPLYSEMMPKLKKL